MGPLDLEDENERWMIFVSGLQSKYKILEIKIETYKRKSNAFTFFGRERDLLTWSKRSSDAMHSFAGDWDFNFDLLLNRIQGMEYVGACMDTWLSVNEAVAMASANESDEMEE